jgi:hypothetical protein
MATPTDHYIPAAFLAGFGGPLRTDKRETPVRVRFKHKPDETFRTKAEGIAGEKDVYRLLHPPSGMLSNAIDTIWVAYEPLLPRAVKAFEDRTWGGDEWATILFHIYAQGVRHPEFATYAAAHLASQGEPSGPDDAQIARITTLAALPQVMARWKFAVLYRSPESNRFVVNDKGYAAVEESETRKAVAFPLSSDVAILGAVDAGDETLSEAEPPDVERTLVRGAVENLNDASWQVPAIRCAIGHPQDERILLRLSEEIPLVQPCLGPYVGKSEYLLDWAFG